jgi:hypothetical protein
VAVPLPIRRYPRPCEISLPHSASLGKWISLHRWTLARRACRGARTVSALRRRISYANVLATLAMFVALGGTSYAVLHISSDDVTDNSLRSIDIRNNTVRSRDVTNHTLRARDVRRNSLGSGAIKEAALSPVPRALRADRLGDATAHDLQVRCPENTIAMVGACIEIQARAPIGFFGALSACDQAHRSLVTMPQLDRFAQSHSLASSEWTSSVYRNPGNGPNPFDELETVLLADGGSPAYSRVYLDVQHRFRCAALPSN